MESVLVCLCVYLSFQDAHFFTLGNAFTILRMISEPGIIAFGMTMVIICGEIDLSVGSAVAFSGCLFATLVEAGLPVPAAIAIALAAGFAAGMLPGLMRVRFQVPTFITTLAMLTGLRGLARLLTKGFPVSPDLPAWFTQLGSGYLFGQVPVAALFLLAVYVAVQLTMSHTGFGRKIYAVGGNAEVARLSGINVSRTRVLVMAITGCLAALSGVLLCGRLSSGNPNVGLGWELDVIAAVIIGGTRLTGGEGKPWGTLLGLVFLGVLTNGMTILDIPLDGQYVVKGALILGAVLVNQMNSGDSWRVKGKVGAGG